MVTYRGRMNTRGITTIALAALLTVAGCSTAEPDPVDTLDADTIATLNEHTLECLDGDMAACNRLRAIAAFHAPDSNYERIGATCGERNDPLPEDDACPVP